MFLTTPGVDGWWGSTMPNRPSHPCRERACAGVVKAGAEACTLGHQQVVRADDTRESASMRGYGARWRRRRAMFLRAHPLCVDPYTLHPGQVVPATDVDHILARRAGGSDRDDNLQSLCHSCHSIKTNRERDGEGRVKSLEAGEQRPPGELNARTRETHQFSTARHNDG